MELRSSVLLHSSRRISLLRSSNVKMLERRRTERVVASLSDATFRGHHDGGRFRIWRLPLASGSLQGRTLGSVRHFLAGEDRPARSSATVRKIALLKRLPSGQPRHAERGGRSAFESHPHVHIRKDHTPSLACAEIETERVGFEPTRALRPYRFSRPAPSTAQPPLQASLLFPEGDAIGRGNVVSPSYSRPAV